MKNRLEAELISIAHRILKLKNKSEIIQLQQEALNLYEKLSVLRFVEENYGEPSVEIPSDVEQRLEVASVTEQEIVIQKELIEEKTEEIIVEKTKEEVVSETKETLISESVEKENTVKQEKPAIEDFQVRFEEFEAQLSNAKHTKSPSIFDEVTPIEEPVFEPVQSTTIQKT